MNENKRSLAEEITEGFGALERMREMEKQVEHYKNKAEALDKRELELLAEIRSLEKDLYMIQRHYDQLDTQLHPESTK